MKLKGILDYDCTNYKKPTLTLMFPTCTFKCDWVNSARVCQNSSLVNEPDVEITKEKIWELYEGNPLTQGFCFQGLEPFDSIVNLYEIIDFIRIEKKCNDDIVIYTGYERDECKEDIEKLKKYPNIIIKWGRFIMNQEPHYDNVLGVKLASDNQYAERLI